MIEADGELACELEMLRLVFADRDVGCVVEEDIGGLKDGVREETELEGVFVGCGLEWRRIVWKGELALYEYSALSLR
jgi:hypothetical protein